MSRSFLVGMMLWNYFLTISTDPGRLPVCLLSDLFRLHLRRFSESERY